MADETHAEELRVVYEGKEVTPSQLDSKKSYFLISPKSNEPLRLAIKGSDLCAKLEELIGEHPEDWGSAPVIVRDSAGSKFPYAFLYGKPSEENE